MRIASCMYSGAVQLVKFTFTYSSDCKKSAYNQSNKQHSPYRDLIRNILESVHHCTER